MPPMMHSHTGSLRTGARVERGLTILEMMITLAVIAILTVIGYNGVRLVRQSSLREDTVQVASLLRAAYNMATTTATHHRVVFDLDEQTVVIEMCQGDVTLRRTDAEELPDDDDGSEPVNIQEVARNRGIPQEILNASSPDEAANLAAALTGERIGGARCGPAELPTGDAEGRGVGRSIRTDRGLKIHGIWTQHLNGEQTGGKVTVNFFPLGFSEKAIIEVGDEDGNYYTLLVHSFTGRIEFRDGRVDAEQFMFYRADGKRETERGERQ